MKHALFHKPTGHIVALIDCEATAARQMYETDQIGVLAADSDISPESHWIDVALKKPVAKLRQDIDTVFMPTRVAPGEVAILLRRMPTGMIVSISGTGMMEVETAIVRADRGRVLFAPPIPGRYIVNAIGRYYGGPWTFEAVSGQGATNQAIEAIKAFAGRQIEKEIPLWRQVNDLAEPMSEGAIERRARIKEIRQWSNTVEAMVIGGLQLEEVAFEGVNISE